MLIERVIVIRAKVLDTISDAKVGELIAARAWEIDGLEGAELVAATRRLDIEPHHATKNEISRTAKPAEVS